MSLSMELTIMITNMIYLIIPVLIQIETGGERFPNEAIGRNGEVGMLQVSKHVVQDVNKFYRPDRKYQLRDARIPWYATEMCYLYLLYWASPERLGREPTFEDLARIWNGGPKGYKNPKTLGYWRRVNSVLHARYCKSEVYYARR